MKYKINYKANDKVIDNPILHFETNDEVPSIIKKLMVPVINGFEKLGYSYLYGRVRLEDSDEADFLSNSVSVVLQDKDFIQIHFLITYDPKKDSITDSIVSKQAIDNNETIYVFLKKEELKILDIYDFTLAPRFIEETKQQIDDWIDENEI